MNKLKLKAAGETAIFVAGCLLGSFGVNMLIMYGDRLPFTPMDACIAVGFGVLMYMIYVMYKIRFEELQRRAKLTDIGEK